MLFFPLRFPIINLYVMMGRGLFALLVVFVLPSGAMAAENALMPFDQNGLVFSRQTVTILASGAMPDTLPDAEAAVQKDKDGKTIVYQQGKEKNKQNSGASDTDKTVVPELIKDKNDTPPLRAIAYNVEVRDDSAYRLESIPSLNYLDDKTAFMIIQKPSQMVNVGMLRAAMPIDLVMVRKNGHILAMMPEVKFMDLQSDIDAGEEVVAVLFLKGGQIKERAIQPSDEVQHKIFDVPPKVLR